MAFDPEEKEPDAGEAIGGAQPGDHEVAASAKDDLEINPIADARTVRQGSVG
jgi:hypothetical protein